MMDVVPGSSGRHQQTTRERLLQSVRPESGEIATFIHFDGDIYAREQQRIFQRCWLFLAHSSEVPEAGDYVVRTLAGDSVIVARGADGRIRAFLNRCRHRGMRVCRADAGNSLHFRCPYHGFTYQNDGRLIGVPYQTAAYGDTLDKSQWSLWPIRIDSYRGFIFGTVDEQAPPLDQYLGDMRWYLDLWGGRAAMEVVGPPARRRVATGWKLPSENFMSDSYHVMHTHASIAKLGLAPRLNFTQNGFQVNAGNGHGLGITMPTESLVFPEDLLPVYRRQLSPEQYRVLQEMRNLHGLVFPNMAIQVSTVTHGERLVSHTSIALFQPVGPAEVEVWSWFLVETEAPNWWKDLSRRMYVLTFSASGIFDQDDMENFTDISAAAGPISRRVSFNYQMGIDRLPVNHFPGPGVVYPAKYCEANARAFYRRWLELMTDDELEEA